MQSVSHRRTARREHRDIPWCPEGRFGPPWTVNLTSDNTASRDELMDLSESTYQARLSLSPHSVPSDGQKEKVEQRRRE